MSRIYRILFGVGALLLILAGCETKEEAKVRIKQQWIDIVVGEVESSWENRDEYWRDNMYYVVHGEMNTIDTIELGDKTRITLYGFEYVSRDKDEDVEAMLEQSEVGHMLNDVQPFVKVVVLDKDGNKESEEYY